MEVLSVGKKRTCANEVLHKDLDAFLFNLGSGVAGRGGRRCIGVRTYCGETVYMFFTSNLEEGVVCHRGGKKRFLSCDVILGGD